MIDYILVNVLPGTPRWWMNIVVGIGFFIVYYSIFTFAIKKWNLATPGRGGRENIRDIDACFTRLRVEVSDVSQINEDELKALGAAGVVKVKNNIQAIFGGRSDLYKNELLRIHKEMDEAN